MNIKTILPRLALIAILSLSSAFARDTGSTTDRAAKMMAQHGYLLVKSAGPTIAAGTYRTEVLLRMGKPEHITADGAWLYPNYEVKNSRINGTLIMRFQDDAISELLLIPSTASWQDSLPTPNHAGHSP